MSPPVAPLALSGERFGAVYHLSCSPSEAAERARAICYEQTVEFPADLIGRDDIEQQVVGRVTALEPVADGQQAATIGYPVEIIGDELPQLLNVLFGNISLLPGIRLIRFELPPALAGRFGGPRFGRTGLRELLGVPVRPLLATALKPLGLAPAELAGLCCRMLLAVDPATELVERVMVGAGRDWIFNRGLGELTFTYLSNVEDAGGEFVPPRDPPTAAATFVERATLFWPLELVDIETTAEPWSDWPMTMQTTRQGVAEQLR